LRSIAARLAEFGLSLKAAKSGVTVFDVGGAVEFVGERFERRVLSSVNTYVARRTLGGSEASP